MGSKNLDCARCKSTNIIQISEEQFQRERAERNSGASEEQVRQNEAQANLNAQEAREILEIEILTVHSHPLKEVSEVKGLVVGVASRTRALAVKPQDVVHRQLVKESLKELRRNAHSVGGNAVLGLTFSLNSDDPGGNLTASNETVVAVGTAVVV